MLNTKGSKAVAAMMKSYKDCDEKTRKIKKEKYFKNEEFFCFIVKGIFLQLLRIAFILF